MIQFTRVGIAFLKRDILEALSYKTASLLQVGNTLLQILIFFFISKLLGTGLSTYLEPYGNEYFPFVLIGLTFASYQNLGLNSFSDAIEKEQETGTLEAICTTPHGIQYLLTANILWPFMTISFRVLAYLAFGGIFLGVDLSRINILSTLVMIALTLFSLMGLGLMAAGYTLVFKQGNPMHSVLHGLSKLLGGVYFPIAVLPIWLQFGSKCLPLTYALEGLRKAILQGHSLTALGPECMSLIGFAALFLPLGFFTINRCIRRAKLEGSLTFY